MQKQFKINFLFFRFYNPNFCRFTMSLTRR